MRLNFRNRLLTSSSIIAIELLALISAWATLGGTGSALATLALGIVVIPLVAGAAKGFQIREAFAVWAAVPVSLGVASAISGGELGSNDMSGAPFVAVMTYIYGTWAVGAFVAAASIRWFVLRSIQDESH